MDTTSTATTANTSSSSNRRTSSSSSSSPNTNLLIPSQAFQPQQQQQQQQQPNSCCPASAMLITATTPTTPATGTATTTAAVDSNAPPVAALHQGTNNDNRRTKQRNRNRKGKKKQAPQQLQQQQQRDDETPPLSSSSVVNNNNNNNNNNNHGKSNPNQRSNNNNKKKNNNNNNNNKTSNGNTNNSTNNTGKKRNYYWWKKHIPPGTVDPITLESLKSLKYPPFALVASEPYVPIPQWPIQETNENQSVSLVDNNNNSSSSSNSNSNNTNNATKQQQETVEERQQRILQEQWGKHGIIPASTSSVSKNNENKNDNNNNNNKETTGLLLDNKKMEKQSETPLHERHVNLFDGQALAYYMVSQLQFIDPLNRRDLTRNELMNLDHYLRRHGFGESLNVIEAYDTKGITLSTAGSVANTATGRAMILQQEAQNLLNALFHRGINTITTRTNNHNNNNIQRQNNNSSRNRNNNNENRNANNNDNYNSFMRQYQAHQDATQRQQLQRMGYDIVDNSNTNNAGQQQGQQQQNNYNINEDITDIGIYGDNGFMIIDDDVNPGLRGRQDVAVNMVSSNNPGSTIATGGGEHYYNNGTFWVGSHISTRHGHSPPPALRQEQEFPSLTASIPVVSSSSVYISDDDQKGSNNNNNTSNNKKLPAAKTLLKIGNAIKKTDPEELQRQWEARELARKKAMLSNLTYGSNQAAWGGGTSSLSPDDDHHQHGIPMHITTTTSLGPTEGQIERNMVLAEALGVKPSTIRSTTATTASLKSGWARPTKIKAAYDEFGRELNTTIYPDELIVKVREHFMAAIIKLETKWISFLEDDTASSLPLNKMDRPLRALVHEYAMYWNITTQSYDPEPVRYIHCSKVRETKAPYPLLSDAVRKWKGPKPFIASLLVEHPSIQTAGQSTRPGSVAAAVGRTLPAPPDRKPLSLKPRSTIHDLSSGFGGIHITDGNNTGGGGGGGVASMMSIGGAPSRTMTESLIEPSESRFGALLGAGRERPKLDLKPRSIPLEPSAVVSNNNIVSEMADRQQKRAERKERKEQKKAKQKQRALQSAFASDDERSKSSSDSSLSRGSKKDNDNDDSDWEEQVPLYAGNDAE